MNLRIKLTLIFIFLITIPSTLIALLAISNASNALVQQALEHADSLASSKENELELFIKSQKDRINGITSRTKLRDTIVNFNLLENQVDRDTVFNIISDAQEPYSDINWIAIFNLDNNLIASTSLITSDENVKVNELLKLIKSGELILFDKTLNKVLVGGEIIRDGELIGYSVYEFESKVLLDLLQDYTGLGKTGEVLLAAHNSEGDAEFLHARRFEKDSNARVIVPKEELNIPITQALLKNEIILTDAIDYRGKSVIGATRYLDEAGWGLVVKIDQEELLLELNNFSKTLFVLVSIIIIFTGFVSYIVAYSIIRPIEDLTETVSRISVGNFDVRVKTTSLNQRNELGVLAKSFNQMAIRLKDLYGGLENKVKERTIELENANKKVQEKLHETERLNKITVDRELKMIDLKKEIEELKNKKQS